MMINNAESKSRGSPSYEINDASSEQVNSEKKRRSLFSWKVDDDQSPSEIYNWRLYLSVFVFGVLGAARGLDEGNISGSLAQVSFQEEFGLNDPNKSADEIADLKSNISAMVQLGSIGGAMIAMYSVDKLGRVRALQVVCIIWIIGAIIQITSHSVGQLYAGRLIEGLAIGQTTSIGPAYLSEVSPRAIRGLCVCIFSGAVYFGVMIEYFAHYESPRWLLKKNRVDEAAKNLSKLRQLPEEHNYIVSEVSDINEQVLREKEAAESTGVWGRVSELFFMRSNQYRLFMCTCLAQILGQWSGANSITIYAPELFALAGITGNDDLKMTAILGVIKFVSAYMTAFFLIDFLGRRRCLYSGLVIQFVTMLYFALFLTIVPQAAEDGATLTASQDHASRSAIAALFLSGVGWTMGFNSIQYLLGAEIFPLNIRSFAQSVTMVLHFACQYGNSKAVPKMLIAMNNFGAFYFFVGVIIVSLFWAWFFIPEVAGRSLESMEDIFNLPWYLIGRKGAELCPDYSEINRIAHPDQRSLQKNDIEEISNVSQMDDRDSEKKSVRE